jgi:lysozyme
MRALGIDVSHWEGLIFWQTAAPKIAFAYYKCTDGIAGIDSQFTNNRNGTKNNSIPNAPYHWYKPNQDGVAQAKHFITTAGKDYKKYIVDVEEYPNPVIPINTNWLNLKNLLTEIVLETGTIPVIYTGYYKWIEQIGYRPEAITYDLILARYTYAKNPTCPPPWKQPKIWQFTDYGFCPGCNEGIGDIDMNWFYGTWLDARDYFGGV